MERPEYVYSIEARFGVYEVTRRIKSGSGGLVIAEYPEEWMARSAAGLLNALEAPARIAQNEGAPS